MRKDFMESLKILAVGLGYTVDFTSTCRFVNTRGQCHSLTFGQRLSSYDNFKNLLKC